MNKNFFSMSNWLMRFRYAFNGLRFSFASEHSIWIHSLATVSVIILSIVKRVTPIEALVILFSVAFVWIAELFNTAIEKLADHVTPGYNNQIKVVKDLSAAAVLIASLLALAAGLIIFVPKFI